LPAQLLQNIVGQVVPAISRFKQAFNHTIRRGSVAKTCKDTRADRILACHV
jgi:hypothetical protein